MTQTQGAAAAVAAVRQALEEHGARGEIRTLEQEVPTAAAAAEALGCPVGAIANSLVFKAGDGIVLVLASGAHRVDARTIATHLGVGRKKVRRADPETVLAATGQAVGGVAPVGHPAPLPTLIDATLADHDVLWVGGGDHHTMVATTLDELVAMTGGTVLDVAG